MKSIIILFISILLLSGCYEDSGPSDIEPVIRGQFPKAKAVYYPSTDSKVSAVVVDENGDVYYLRMNGFNAMRDNERLFNVNDFQK